MDAQYGGQRIGRPAALLAGLGVMGLDQVNQRLPGHHLLHLREKPLPFGLLFGGGELVIREAELLTAHQTSPGLRSRPHCRAEGLVFQSLPSRIRNDQRYGYSAGRSDHNIRRSILQQTS